MHTIIMPAARRHGAMTAAAIAMLTMDFGDCSGDTVIGAVVVIADASKKFSRYVKL